MEANVKIDSYGGCHRNRDGKVEKVEALKHYKFSLAFENTNKQDYVTEKFFQSLVAGSVPVVVGAPNIEEFAPSPDSFLHIKQMGDVKSVAKKMKYPNAYNQTLRSDGNTKALQILSRHLLIWLLYTHLVVSAFLWLQGSGSKKRRALSLREDPANASEAQRQFTFCMLEKGQFDMESIFLKDGNLTLEALEFAVLAKFKSLRHEPIWKERPASLIGDGELRVHGIYPFGLTQREALYNFKFEGN